MNYDCAEERRSFKSVFATDLRLLLLFKNSIIPQIQKEPGRVVWFFAAWKRFRIILRDYVTKTPPGEMHTSHMDDGCKRPHFGERMLEVGFSFKLWEIFRDFLCKKKLFGEDV